LKNLKDGERQREKSRSNQVESKTKQRHEGEHQIGEDDETMMEWNGSFPGEATEQGATFVFLVFREGNEITNKEIGECQNRERQKQKSQQPGRFPSLKDKSN